MKQFYAARIQNFFFQLFFSKKNKMMKLVACIRQRAIGSKLAKTVTCGQRQKNLQLQPKKDMTAAGCQRQERFVTGKICYGKDLYQLLFKHGKEKAGDLISDSLKVAHLIWLQLQLNQLLLSQVRITRNLYHNLLFLYVDARYSSSSLSLQSYISAMSNSSEVPPGLAGKESIIFGNIEDIYNFHNRFAFSYMTRLLRLIAILTDENRSRADVQPVLIR